MKTEQPAQSGYYQAAGEPVYAEPESAVTALRRLVELKDYKDRNGKNPWYEAVQPKAWENARAALESRCEISLLDPDMPAQELRLHMGEMTAQEERTARASIRWANSRCRDISDKFYGEVRAKTGFEPGLPPDTATLSPLQREPASSRLAGDASARKDGDRESQEALATSPAPLGESVQPETVAAYNGQTESDGPRSLPSPSPTNTRNRINKIISGCMTRGMSSEATTDEVWEYLHLNKNEKWYAPDDISYENTMLRGKLVEAKAVIETVKSFAEPLKDTDGVCGAIVEFIEGNAP